MSLKPKKKASSDDDDIGAVPVIEVRHKRSFVFYGRSGSGKTTLSSTFPGPILLLDCRDKGTDSIADVEDVFVKYIETFEDFEETYFKLRKKCKYKTIVIDTVTQVQQMALEEVTAGKKKKLGDDKQIGDWGTLTKQDWGKVAGKMKMWIDNYRDLPANVVFLAQERVSRDEDADDSDNQLAPEVGPRTMPSVASALNAAVSVIGNTFIMNKKTRKEIKGKKVEKQKAVYCLRVGPNPIYTTKLRKSRKVEAPAYIEDPTYEDIIEVIKSKE